MPTYAETMLNAYEEARLVGSRIHVREKLAAHWLIKVDWFNNRLARTCQLEADLEDMHIPVPTQLSEATKALMRIVEECQGHYEIND
jgi:hypothetical protein